MDTADNAGRGIGALNRSRGERDACQRQAPAQCVENVLQGGSTGGGDNADAPRESRQRTLELGGEQPFGFEAGF